MTYVRTRTANPYEAMMKNGCYSEYTSAIPRVNVSEEETRYNLEAELPGLEEKDIEIKVEGNVLSLSKKEKEEEKEAEGRYLLRERKTGPFSRSFLIPDNVDKEGISAVYSNGVLTLTMKKKEKALPREIEVKTA